MKIEYIDNDVNNGIKYDFKKIFKRYKELNVPKEFNIIPYYNMSARWNVFMSERSNGKTTNVLLLGMIMNDEYGTTIEYIRMRESMIAPKNSKNIFDTILQHDYVSKITKGKWNSVTYNSKRWYYCNRDENGEIIEKCNTHFMAMLSIDKQEDYKSSYNAPYGDWIVLDEFIGTYTPLNAFIEFNQLVKTIIRERQSAYITLLANTINTEHIFFEELEIMEQTRLLERGEKQLLQSERGTYVNVVIFNSLISEKKERNIVNKLYFGWRNPLMSGITGSDTWSISNYQHDPNLTDIKVIASNIYILHNNILIRLELRKSSEIPIYVHCYRANRIKDDSIIFTLGDIIDNRYVYGFGYNKLHKMIWSLYKRNLFYYRTNMVGNIVNDFYNNVKKGGI